MDRLQTIHERMASDRRQARWAATAWLIIFTAILWLIVGCATVRQDPVKPTAASFDGNDQNSGVLRSVPEGYVVTAHFRDRYRALTESYGHLFRPALATDSGIRAVGDAWIIDREHMVKFLTMNQWDRMARKSK